MSLTVLNNLRQDSPNRRHPNWIKVRLPSGENFYKLRELMRNAKLHTICEEARCPNIGECWDVGTATFLILGEYCTRHCRYCNVKTGKPNGNVDTEEPLRVAETVREMGLKYVVVTCVTRDDLSDGGANIFVETINAIRKLSPDCKVEVLTSDFLGDVDNIRIVTDGLPDVFAHNIETVERLYPVVRMQGKYEWAIKLLSVVKDIKPEQLTKSSLIVGLGETHSEIVKTMIDLRGVGCDIFTVGQYLQPTNRHHPVIKYYSPEEFAEIRKIGLEMGFKYVHSGPLVRSSYHAEKCVS
ncbi:MAG: lipoyl synthase [Nanoarchaeota archaeon]